MPYGIHLSSVTVDRAAPRRHSTLVVDQRDAMYASPIDLRNFESARCIMYVDTGITARFIRLDTTSSRRQRSRAVLNRNHYHYDDDEHTIIHKIQNTYVLQCFATQ